MNEKRPTPNAGNSKRFEDLAVLAFIIMGFGVSLILFLNKADMPGIAIWTATAMGASVAALVYRFLGGIDEKTSFNVGAFKVGGTLAALVGFAFVANNIIEARIDGYRKDELGRELKVCQHRFEEYKKAREDEPRAMVMQTNDTHIIKGVAVKLLAVDDLKTRSLAKVFKEIIKKIDGNTNKSGTLSLARKQELLAEFCMQIGFAFHVDEAQRKALKELARLYTPGSKGWKKTLNRKWWGEFSGPLLKERCTSCPEEYDIEALWQEWEGTDGKQRKKDWWKEYGNLQYALSDFPYAVIRLKDKDGGVEFKTIVPGGGGITVAEEKHEVRVIANPKRIKTRSLIHGENDDPNPVHEGIVLLRSDDQ